MKRWQDPSWAEEMKLELDANLMMAPPLAPGAGISSADLDRLSPRLTAIQQKLESDREAGRLPFLTVPYQPGLVQEIKKYVRGVKGWVENFVVLGSGGSALGARALQTALNPPSFNLLSRTMRKGFPRLFVAESIDPDGFQALLELVDLRKTLFQVISKSAGTAGTISQYLIVRDLLKRRGGNRKESEHLVVTTDPEAGNLRKIIRGDGVAGFEIPPLPGGRFSILSAVGLLPAAMVGIDIEELLAGARDMDRRCRDKSLWKNPAALGAALAFLACGEKKRTIRVFMPYVDALSGIGDWFARLWVESLGQRVDRQGREIRTGQTPVCALGAANQRSQSRPPLEGPADGLFTFVGVKAYGATLPIPAAGPPIEAWNDLSGHSLNELIQSELQATRLTLARVGRPSLLITLPRVNPFTVGQLLFLLELETYLCGQLLEINPLEQPGVEEGKNLAYALLGRKGYENSIQDWEPFLKTESRFII
ncbi:MAG: glucose-6-phosphate isomerase [Desulfobacterota bacterium]|nr:glucose-6-phosphate isomerase [Thermodesulfobacteriota bacterium]